MKYRVVAPVRTRLVPGAIIDERQVENPESLVRLGVLTPYTPKKKKPSKKAAGKKAAK